MKFSIRTFKPGDETQLCALWNNTLPEDNISQSEFTGEILLDQNFSPESLFLAFKENRLIGVTGGLKRRIAFGPDGLESERGWLLYFFVDEEYRSHGIGSKLLTAFENWMRDQGVRKISFSDYTPGYLLPGLDFKMYPEGFNFLRKRGYKTASSPIAMRKDLSGFSISDKLSGLIKERTEEGYRFKKPEERDYYPMIEFCQKEFSYDWERIIREAVITGKADRNINIACSPDGEVLGFAGFGLVGSEQNRFGPFGVGKKFRGLSLGKILLNQCLENIAQQKFRDTFFLWTYEDDPAGFLYSRTGFEIFRRFHILEKELC